MPSKVWDEITYTQIKGAPECRDTGLLIRTHGYTTLRHFGKWDVIMTKRLRPRSYVKILIYMMTSSNGNIFALLAICARIHQSPVNSPHKGQRRGALMFTLICVWITLCKQSWGWWFETLLCPLWRHSNDQTRCLVSISWMEYITF